MAHPGNHWPGTGESRAGGSESVRLGRENDLDDSRLLAPQHEAIGLRPEALGFRPQQVLAQWGGGLVARERPGAVAKIPFALHELPTKIRQLPHLRVAIHRLQLRTNAHRIARRIGVE